MRTSYQNNPAVIALKNRARATGTPLFGGFEITSRCNLDCKMCYVHNMDVKEALRTELTTEQWISIMDAAYDNGMLFALLTGGECLLRKDFKELYLHLYNKGVFVSVNTNAVLIDEEMADFFQQHMPERIQVSLYGSSNSCYERVTGYRQFDRVFRALKLLKDRKLPLEIGVTPSTWLVEDFKDILLRIKELDLPFYVTTALIEPRESTQRAADYLSDEQKLMVLRQEFEHRGIAFTPTERPAPPFGCTDGEVVKGMPCNAGTIRFFITSQGNMIPCASIDSVSINALENDFVSCWKYIHETMSQVVQPSRCQKCVYNKYCDMCPAVRYPGLFDGVADERLCHYQQKKFSAGLIKLPCD